MPLLVKGRPLGVMCWRPFIRVPSGVTTKNIVTLEEPDRNKRRHLTPFRSRV